jgi:DNA-binding PadR family transcriptional regulator
MEKEIKKSAEFFEKQMKKGFISTLILLVLENKPSHGYGILKEIEKRTLNVWSPSTSSIYRILESLEEKNIVKCIDEQESGRQKKTYNITDHGKKILKRLIQKYERIHESMQTIVTTTIGLTENYEELKNIKDLIAFRVKPIFRFDKEISDEEKIKQLSTQKLLLEGKIKNMKKELQNVEKELKNLQKSK